MSKAISWFLTTATIIGVPVTLGLILTGVERSFHTLTCETLRYGCSRSLFHQVSYIVDQVDSTHDVVLTPAPKSKK